MWITAHLLGFLQGCLKESDVKADTHGRITDTSQWLAGLLKRADCRESSECLTVRKLRNICPRSGSVINIDQLVMVLTDELLVMVKINNVCTAGYSDD